MLGLITSACGDDKGTSETETGPSTGGATTGTSTGPASDGTTTDPTTSAGPTTEQEGTSEPDATTGPEATTGPATTSGATTTTTTTGEDTDVPETGVVEGVPVLIEDRCAPDDGPALEFKVGVSPADCSGDFPEDAPIITVSLWQGGPLEPGDYPLAGGNGFASFDDGDGAQTTETGTISVIEWNAGFPYGAIELSFPDGTEVSEAFQGFYCPGRPPCK